jgi:choline monooxygenase
VPREETLRRFDPTKPIEEATTPPYVWYTDPSFYLDEKNDIFEKSWIAVGRVDQVATVGEYFTGEICGNPYMVVRGEDGVLRAFHNVCRHKAHVVAQSCGTCEHFVCPYHGWTYKLDGSIKKIPHLGKVENFHEREFSLKPCGVDTWGPFVFIDLDAFWGNSVGKNRRDLHKDLDPLKGPLEELGLDRMKFYERRVYTMNCNWKVFIENSLDGGYHVAYAHESLAQGLQFDGYETVVTENTAIQTCTTVGTDKRLGGKVIYAWMFPNFFVNRYGNMMDTNIVLPLSVDKCQVIFDFYFDYENAKEWEIQKTIKRSIEESDRIQQEDVSVCESSQKGMNSMAFDYGHYSPKLEQAVHAFHRMVWSNLSGRSI